MLQHELSGRQTDHTLWSHELSVHTAVFQVMLDYVFQLARHQRHVSIADNLPDTLHLQWADERAAIDSNNPNIIVPPRDVLTESRVSALLLLLRSPESYDGSTDFLFERLMKCVIGGLVDPEFVVYLR